MYSDGTERLKKAAYMRNHTVHILKMIKNKQQLVIHVFLVL